MSRTLRIFRPSLPRQRLLLALLHPSSERGFALRATSRSTRAGVVGSAPAPSGSAPAPFGLGSEPAHQLQFVADRK